VSAVITRAAPAKVNLTLEVVERLPNGYHRIRSVMVRLRHLADAVRVRVDGRASGIHIGIDSAEIPADESNLCHRAARAYLDHAREAARVDVHISKAIPVAAGLGGGSSDAAAVLIALNRHFGNRIAPRRLARIASDIGKDVPFFLAPAMVNRVSGMGEIVHGIGSLPSLHCLVVNPRIAVSTREAYAALRASLWFMERPDRIDRSQAMVSAIKARNGAGIAAALYNDFELVAERMHPIVKEVKQSLLALGARGALMSGSGPTVFGLFASRRALVVAEGALRSHYPSFSIDRG
jgi:4-diphosphocytidyl-2-C-methyl-D-erythritol kinase